MTFVQSRKLLDLWSTGKKGKLIVMENMFTLLCCQAADASKYDQMKSPDLLIVLAVNFDTAMNFALLDSYMVSELFTHSSIFNATTDAINGALRWPTEFVEYVNAKKAVAPSETWIAKHKKNSNDNTMKQFFGEHIAKVYEKAKKNINNILNPRWIPPEKLRSGESTTSAFNALRKYAIKPTCVVAATKYIQDKIRKNHSDTKEPDFDRGTAIILDASRRQTEISTDWFPEYWLAFTIASLPAEHKALPSLITKNIAEHLFTNNVSSKKQYGRNARRAMIAATASKRINVDRAEASDAIKRLKQSSPSVFSTPTKGSNQVFDDHVSFEIVENDPLQLLKGQIELMKEMNENGEYSDEIRKCNLALLQMYRKKTNL
jgi:hypothetical protein